MRIKNAKVFVGRSFVDADIEFDRTITALGSLDGPAELDAQERRLRRTAMGQRPVACADEAYKSYGVLKYARRLTRKDAMEFLSQIMAGAADGILKMKEPCSVYGLMLGIQPANLLSQAERPLSREELDAARADFLRARLPEII